MRKRPSGSSSPTMSLARKTSTAAWSSSIAPNFVELTTTTEK